MKNGKAQPDPEVDALVIAESEKKGITTPRLQQYGNHGCGILTAMRNEGDKILSEGIANSADAIDVVMITGYGLPEA